MAKSATKNGLAKPSSLVVETGGTEYGGITMDDIARVGLKGADFPKGPIGGTVTDRGCS